MNISILIPHYKSKITAYAIHKILENKGEHEIEIIIIDNSQDESIKYFEPFMNDIVYLKYPKDVIQSHGCAFDWAINNGYVKNDNFITMESDSFPTNNKAFDLYEKCINEGYETGGSLLWLSGGEYLHPCFGFFKKSIWQEAKDYCDNIEYSYFPNMSYSFGFNCHLMIHNSVIDSVLETPEDYIELANDYKGLSKEEMLAKRDYYKPVVAPFHNGMGKLNETLATYGRRCPKTGVPNILLNGKPKLINRIGYEPGQWFFYWQLAMKKKVIIFPTETKWLPNRDNQQQEYTETANGLRHIWCGSSYLDMKESDPFVYEFKHNQIEELYNSLPENLKIK